MWYYRYGKQQKYFLHPAFLSPRVGVVEPINFDPAPAAASEDGGSGSSSVDQNLLL